MGAPRAVICKELAHQSVKKHHSDRKNLLYYRSSPKQRRDFAAEVGVQGGGKIVRLELRLKWHFTFCVLMRMTIALWATYS